MHEENPLRLIKCEGATAGAAHSEQIDIGVKSFLDKSEIATGYWHDGEVGSEVGEECCHDDSLVCLGVDMSPMG